MSVRERLEMIWRRIFEQHWLNLGLRGKMSFMIEVGLVGLIASFMILGVSTARQTTQRILGERMMLARLSASTVDSALRHVRSVLEITASSHLWSAGEDDNTEWRVAIDAAFAQLGRSIQGIYLLDTAGNEVYSAAHSDLTLAWPELRGKTVATGAQGDGATGHANLGREIVIYELPTNSPWAVMKVPLYDEQGELEGWLAAILDFDRAELAPFQGAIDLGRTGALDLVNADGRVLISSHPERQPAPGSIENVKKLFVSSRPGVETCLGCSGADNPETSDEVIAFAPLNQAVWGVIVRQRNSELMAPVNKLLIQTLTLGVFTVIGALLLVLITTNSVIHPVQKLTEAARRISTGDLTTPMDELFSDWFNVRRLRKDEIGALAKNFETMRQQLKRSMDEVQALNRELDERVHARTAEALTAQMQAQGVRDDLRAIIDALDDELVVVGVDDHRVLLVNRAAQTTSDLPSRRIGQLCYETCPMEHPCPPDAGTCPITAVMESGEAARLTQEIEEAPGRITYREIVASPMLDAEGRITRVVELTRDVTEERRIKASLIHRNQQLSILNQVATTVNSSLKLEDILDGSLEAVLRLTEVDMGAVFLFEELQGVLRLMAYRGMSPEAAQVAANMGLLDSSCGGVVEHGRLVIVPEIWHYKGVRARSLQREGVNTLVHVPLTAKGCVLGSMCVGTRVERVFDEEEQDLLRAIGNQIAVAVENARLYAEVQTKERMRGELFAKAINAQEDERKRIARELHDETSQSLTALLFAAEEAVEMKSLAAARKRLSGMHDLIQHTLDGVHKLIFDLRPSVLDHLGLAPAIRWLGKQRLEPKGVRITVEGDELPQRLPAELETALFRVMQEAITNIARHSAARNVSVTCAMESGCLQLRVEDDGVGFNLTDLEPTTDTPRGLGLLGMQERLELLGGEIRILSSPGSGTLLEISVPVQAQAVGLNGGNGAHGSAEIV